MTTLKLWALCLYALVCVIIAMVAELGLAVAHRVHRARRPNTPAPVVHFRTRLARAIAGWML